ncbi:uncharacterized protein LOC135495038 [Lineus longissimus]|uniref:uncharacterized protein LOC135495038 n=1 Tax=Lineus longissimus TaxID=88925 RepID=UPI00315CBC1F
MQRKIQERIDRDHLRIFLVLNAGAAQQYHIFTKKDRKKYLAKAHVIKYSGVKHDSVDAIELLTKSLKSKKLKRTGVRRAILFLGGVSVDQTNRAKVSGMMIKEVLTQKLLVFYLPMGSNPNVPFWNQFISEAYLLEGSVTADTKFVVKTMKYIMGLVRNEECMPGRTPRGTACIATKTAGSVSKRIKEVIDVMVVLDGSSATGRKKFDQLKQFVIYLLTNYQISQKYMRVFLISWGHRLHTYRFYGGNDQVVTAQYINEVREVLYAKSKSHVGLILGKVLEVVRDKEFLRPGVSRVILLFGALQTEGARGQQTTALVQNILSYRTFMFYMAYGKKTDDVFWKKALPVGYVFDNVQPKLIWFIKVMNTIYEVTGKKSCAKGYKLTKNRCIGKGKVNKRIKLKLNLVVIIDASVNTGKVHYSKVKQLLLYLLDNYLISKEYLTLKIIYAGRKVQMLKINDTRSIQVLKKAKANIASKFPYVDATLQTSDSFKFLVKRSGRKGFHRKDVGTAIFMLGGCRIERDKRTLVTNWVKQLVGLTAHVYYLAYGAKTDVPFWTKVIYKYNIQTRTMGSLRWFKGFMADVMSVMRKKGCMRGYYKDKKKGMCLGALNKCKHPQVWNGKRCVIMKKSRIVLDLIIVIDGSSNTGREKFNDIKRFTTLILENYVISKSALRIYVIVCGRRTHQFQFLDSQSGKRTKEFAKQISSLEYTGSKPDVMSMMEALHQVVGRKDLFVRRGVKRVAFLMGSFKPKRRAKTDVSTELKLISSYRVFIFYMISGRKVERTFWRQELHMNHIISRMRLTLQGIRSRLNKIMKVIAKNNCMDGYELKKNMCVVKLPKADTCAKEQEYDKKAKRCVRAGDVNGPLAPSKGCMKLYPHKLGQGSEKIPNPSGKKWTSKLCRDYCEINPKCLAVDWKAIERACLLHTSSFKPMKATKKYSKHPGSIAQYAKEGKCHDHRRKIELNLLLVVDASSDTGRENFKKIQKAIRDLLEDFAFGPKKLKVEILISLAGAIKHFKLPTDTKAFGQRTKFLSLVYEVGKSQNQALLVKAAKVVSKGNLFKSKAKAAILIFGAFKAKNGDGKAMKTTLRQIIAKKVHILYIASGKHDDVRFWRKLIPKNYTRKGIHSTESWWNRLLSYISRSTKKGVGSFKKR